jgi:hypothetical protein
MVVTLVAVVTLVVGVVASGVGEKEVEWWSGGD